MESLRNLLRTLTATVGIMGFMLALVGALLAGVDPLFAALRAGLCAAGLLIAFSLLSHCVPFILDAGPETGDNA